MKILLVSWSILPYKGGSSIIVENLAQNFSQDELVILGGKRFFQDTDLNRPASFPKIHYFFSEMSIFGRGYRFFDWFRKLRFKPLVRKIKSIIKSEGIDYVIGVFPNAFYCRAACQAAKELGLPFSSYFHNTYIDNVAITDPNAANIQQEIFDYSDKIFVMSKGMQRFYEKKYKLDKFIPLVHTFNEFPSKCGLKCLPGQHKKKYRLVAIGNFNESNMDATIRFAAAICDHPKYSLSLFTHVPKTLLKMRGMDTSSIDHEGFVNPEKVHEVLQNYDICVLTHGFTGGYGEIEYETIFPTRTIPLLLSGKPIIVHSPKGSFLNAFIQENECAELVDEPNAQAIIESLDRITESLPYQEQLVKAAHKTSEQFYGLNVVSELREILVANMAKSTKGLSNGKVKSLKNTAKKSQIVANAEQE